jgi:BlaI family transcriptional regulator, penicillinase repressor
VGQTKLLTELQLAVIQVLWERGEATVAQVHETLHPERGLALTTIATILARLEKDGIVTHRAVGRQYIYRPLVSQVAVQRSVVEEVVTRLFQGDPAALVSHLLRDGEMTADDLVAVRKLIEAYEERVDPGQTDG